VGATLCTVFGVGAVGPAPNGPLRTAPTEKLTVNPGFRDWVPRPSRATTILGGNSSNRGGLFAIDTLTGKVKWASRPTGLPHAARSSRPRPPVSGDIVITPMGNMLGGLCRSATGKESVARSSYRAGGDGRRSTPGWPMFWGRTAISTRWTRLPAAKDGRWDSLAAARVSSVPIVRNGTVYLSGNVPRDAGGRETDSASYYRHLFALDANTGQERWRYPSRHWGGTGGVCSANPSSRRTRSLPWATKLSMR